MRWCRQWRAAVPAQKSVPALPPSQPADGLQSRNNSSTALPSRVVDSFVFPEPWSDLRGHDVADADERRRLAQELRREVAKGHVLRGRAVETIACCQHCDDAVFALPDGQYAVVHLSYAGGDSPPWPTTELFEDAEMLVSYLERHAQET